MMKEIELGDKVKDRVTGFIGIVIGITTWLYGCNRAIVQPEGLTKEGKTFDNLSFDVPQLVVVSKKKVNGGLRNTGGPRQTPIQKTTPHKF